MKIYDTREDSIWLKKKCLREFFESEFSKKLKTIRKLLEEAEFKQNSAIENGEEIWVFETNKLKEADSKFEIAVGILDPEKKKYSGYILDDLKYYVEYKWHPFNSHKDSRRKIKSIMVQIY